jgi:DNA-binding IclR family transcriptional regulator
MQARRTLQRELAEIRKRGYATNFEESAQGVTAVGACVRNPAGKAVAALAIACPSARCPRPRVPELAETLVAACESARRVI